MRIMATVPTRRARIKAVKPSVSPAPKPATEAKTHIAKKRKIQTVANAVGESTVFLQKNAQMNERKSMAIPDISGQTQRINAWMQLSNTLKQEGSQLGDTSTS
mmetsp:Transcript_38832/g.90322  ORF Transcript_38832/g.90322 Transcript_38832/m.90322 type:complete len:103 (-) Transcript_38832:922-1230(-)